MSRARFGACLLLALAGAQMTVGWGQGGYGHHGGGGTLRLCLARMDDKGVVRIREINSSPPREIVTKVLREKDGKAWEEEIKTTHTYVSEHIIHVDRAALKVWGTDNKPVNGDRLPELLQKETPVVLLDSERKIDPRLLPILKKGTLIVVLPMPSYGGGDYNGAPVPETLPPKKMPAEKIAPPPTKKLPEPKKAPPDNGA